METLELSLGEVIVAHPLADHAWGRTPPFPFPTTVCHAGGGGVSIYYLEKNIYNCISVCSLYAAAHASPRLPMQIRQGTVRRAHSRSLSGVCEAKGMGQGSGFRVIGDFFSGLRC